MVEAMSTAEKYVSDYLRRKSILLTSSEQEEVNRRVYRNIEIKFRIKLSRKILRTELFGSCARGTNLPKKYDPNTDLDVLVIFNDDSYDRTPETYRNVLRDLVESSLNVRTVKKKHPAVVIEQDSVNVDLVPCVLEDDDYLIPAADNKWRDTDPHDYTNIVADHDEAEQDHLRRLIRLLKYWNVQRNERFDAFELEMQIIDSFCPGDSFAEEFFDVVDSLDGSDLSQTSAQYLDGLKSDAEWLQKYMQDANTRKIEERLSRIFPGHAFTPW